MAENDWRAEKKRLIARYHEENLRAEKGGVVFAGSSLMEMLPLEALAAELPEPKPPMYNRGVGGYTTADLLPVLDICVWELAPRMVFINIGTNDLSNASVTVPDLIDRYDRILREIEAHLPGVALYLMAYYPVNPDAARDEGVRACLRVRTNARIREANEAVQELAARHHQRYIDVNAPITDAQGRLRAEYTLEGMHINPAGYRALWQELKQYVTE